MSSKPRLRSQIVTSNSHASEGALIADQLRRAFYGTAWHGPSVMELLEEIDTTTAAAKPIANVHSIWELLLHIVVWDRCSDNSSRRRKIPANRHGQFPAASNQANSGGLAKGNHKRQAHT